MQLTTIKWHYTGCAINNTKSSFIKCLLPILAKMVRQAGMDANAGIQGFIKLSNLYKDVI